MVKKEDLKRGRVFCAKRPQKIGIMGYLNDRHILHVGEFTVQYDSPTVRMGRRYPRVEIEKFLKWADKDVTSEMPKGEWRS